MRRAMTVAAAVAVLAGCGGEPEPAAEDQRRALARWAQQADAACRRAETAIMRRGEPEDSVDIDRVVVRAAADVRRAAGEIRRLRVPEGGERQVRPVLAAVEKLEEVVANLEEWSAVGKEDELIDAARDWRLESVALEVAARDAGLEVCGRDRHADAVADAIVAPIYARQFAELSQFLGAAMARVERQGPASTAEHFEALGAVLRDGLESYRTLEPPRRAANEVGTYEDALAHFAAIARRTEREARRGTITGARRAALGSEFDRVARELRRAGRRLARALRPRAATEPAAEGEEIEA